MIIIIHHNNKPISVVKNATTLDFDSGELSSLLFEISKAYPSELIIWCHKDLEKSLNFECFPEIFHHSLIMASFSTSKSFVISDEIGYVDQSPFININYHVNYPTWKMSSDIGGVSAQILRLVANKVKKDSNFEYFLNSLAKNTMASGLLCYSEPKLLKIGYSILPKKKNSKFILFKFVKQHYKNRWLLLLSLNYMLYEKKLIIFFLLRILFFKSRTSKIDFKNIEIKSEENNFSEIDVIIPTIGRKKYLYDVLKDLNEQSILPKNVIIVEQNPNKNSSSELDYLKNESWKFTIKHTFTHQTGACNARNIALQKVTSDWVFFADDDIRIKSNFIKKTFNITRKLKTDAITVSCLLESEAEKYTFPFQWSTFGSGCSIVKISNVKTCIFDMAFEYGFGEDADFGMQLRNHGVDIIYTPSIKILHLKAPVGGFRTKFVHQWEKELIQPKPSPTVMLFNKKYNSEKQLLGYKTLLFFKFYKRQKIKNPFKYLRLMQKRWRISEDWSKTLQNSTYEF